MALRTPEEEKLFSQWKVEREKKAYEDDNYDEIDFEAEWEIHKNGGKKPEPQKATQAPAESARQSAAPQR
ncbi:MAG: hypothetical protein J6L81_05040, partial [Clostridia bacterium]|nr:hypothetical protein [Clostridia bacterium]